MKSPQIQCVSTLCRGWSFSDTLARQDETDAEATALLCKTSQTRNCFSAAGSNVHTSPTMQAFACKTLPPGHAGHQLRFCFRNNFIVILRVFLRSTPAGTSRLPNDAKFLETQSRPKFQQSVTPEAIPNNKRSNSIYSLMIKKFLIVPKLWQRRRNIKK